MSNNRKAYQVRIMGNGLNQTIKEWARSNLSPQLFEEGDITQFDTQDTSNVLIVNEYPYFIKLLDYLEVQGYYYQVTTGDFVDL